VCGAVQPRCWTGSPRCRFAHSALGKTTLSASTALRRVASLAAPHLHHIGRPNAGPGVPRTRRRPPRSGQERQGAGDTNPRRSSSGGISGERLPQAAESPPGDPFGSLSGETLANRALLPGTTAAERDRGCCDVATIGDERRPVLGRASRVSPERRSSGGAMPSDVARMATSDLTEISRLFRSKLQYLREQEPRNQRGRGRRSRKARGQARLQAIEVPPRDDALLRSSEVARLLNVTPKTVWRWATQEGLPTVRTLGGHRRYRWGDVRAWIVDA
jgi:excisionase family DNA binding protein